MAWQALLTNLIPIIGKPAVTALAGKLKGLVVGEAWQQTIIDLLADAVEEHGVEGIRIALTAITAFTKNEVPDIDWANPRTASDLVAQMQSAEADEKSAMRDFSALAGDVFGELGAAVIKGILATL